MMKIIDISKYQTTVDYQAVKDAGVDGVILRCGITYWGKQVVSTDPLFLAHYNGFRAVGMPIGAYYYSAADTVEVARKEAEYVKALLKGKQFEFPVYYDVENEQRMGKLSKEMLTAIVETFCETLEDAGYFVGVYANTNYFVNKLDHARLAGKYTIWLADYRGANADKTLKRDMFQYTSKGTVKGIAGNVDVNECYRDFPPIIKGVGLNGFSGETSNPAPVPKPSSFFPAKGWFGMGDKHENVAKIAAFMRRAFPAYTDERALGSLYGPYIQKAVREFQRRTGIESDGNTGPITLSKLKEFGFEA
jgi:GH25 family lysozyme M1 (1,4-beta-N-acetylmuramidase)